MSILLLILQILTETLVPQRMMQLLQVLRREIFQKPLAIKLEQRVQRDITLFILVVAMLQQTSVRQVIL